MASVIHIPAEIMAQKVQSKHKSKAHSLFKKQYWKVHWSKSPQTHEVSF